MKIKNRLIADLRTSVILLVSILILLVVWSFPLSSHGQTGRRSGSISGRVVTEDGQPVEGATINCVTPEQTPVPRTAMSDADGNFAFTGLSPTVYRLMAYAPGLTSAMQLGGDGIAARIGETHTLTLVKGGVVTGRVTNAAGEPVVGVQVGAIRLRDGEGKPVRSSGPIRSRQTDDRGIYRLYGLPTGNYLVVANPTSGLSFQASAYDQIIPTFFPSSNRDGATEIGIQTGAEISGIDIRYRDIRGHAISGTVEGGQVNTGTMNFGAYIELRSGGSIVASGNAYGNDPGGVRSFNLNGIADGDYDLFVRANISIEEVMISAPRRVTVRGADVTGVRMMLTPLAKVSGKVMIEGGSVPADCEKGREAALTEILLRTYHERKTTDEDFLTVPALRLTDVVKPTGEFTLLNLQAGPHWLMVDLPGENWYLKSVTMPGPSAARKPIDLGRAALPVKAGEKIAGVTATVAEGAATFAGKVAGEGVKRGRWRVYLMPVDAAQADNTLVYYEAVVRGDGGFTFEHLAPGKYWVLARAWPEDQPMDGPVRRAAWDTAERAKLRKEAEAAKQEVELKACQRVKDAVLVVK